MAKESIVVYSHYVELHEKVVRPLQQRFGAEHVFVREDDGITQIIVEPHKKFWSSGSRLTLNTRQRIEPDYKLDELNDAVTQNLAGMYNMLSGFPASNENVKAKLLIKITTINMEMAVIAEPGFTDELKKAIAEIVHDLDAFVFSFAGASHTLYGLDTQGIFDKNGRLLIDSHGNCQVEDLEVHIERKYRSDDE